MRDELVVRRAPSASSPTALALGTLCLGAAVVAMLASRRAVSVVPAQAGTHAEREAPLLSLITDILKTVVPAEAGSHAEYAGTRLKAVRPATHAVYGARPAPGVVPGSAAERRVDAGGVYHAAALLALSVLLDSAVEHSRGNFENPGMFAPLASSFATSLAAARAIPNTAIYSTALAIGAAGSGFHIYNVARRPGGFCWQNLFYAAPLGAPAALGLAGILGLAAQRIQLHPASASGRRAICAIAGIGMAGSAAEAALLHFRGAYHRPAMWLPVTVPPIGAIFLLRAATGARDRLARAWLGLTALLGVVGVAFHANGIAKQMGGWSNWRQNVLSGPPLPAPPSFLALALAGRAALAAR